MSAIITDQIRILNAKNFVAGVSTSTNSYYAFVGLPNPTSIVSTWDSAPPAPIDSFNNMNDYYDTMMAVKRITSADVKQLFQNKVGVQVQRYDYYRHDYSISNAPPKLWWNIIIYCKTSLLLIVTLEFIFAYKWNNTRNT